jgi:hypothetical protein
MNDDQFHEYDREILLILAGWVVVVAGGMVLWVFDVPAMLRLWVLG